ncbi:protein spartin isoform X1 [Planococcus citri]|uniref:protein spartin isoform X1 n=1 Tax=Planococcus citri TaxID=170843 RepID=UPI0031F7B3BE
MNSDSLSISSDIAECIKNSKDIINEVVTLEQTRNWTEAIKKLEITLKQMDELLNQTNGTDIPSNQAEANDNLLLAEINSLRVEVIQHLENCNTQLLSDVEAIAPPSYEEAMSTSTSACSQDSYDGSTNSSCASHLSYSELGCVLENLKSDTGAQSSQMIYSCDDVTLYFISSLGTVSVSSGPETVRIFEIEDGGRESLPKYYLQIYTFVYPLIPKVSPCIKTEFGAILLPNINIERNENSDIESVGLVVKKEKEEEFISTLENILQTKIVLCNTKEPAHISVKISECITNGAEYVSNFLINGAQKAGEFLDGNTPKLMNKINPANENRRVAPCVSNGIRIARDVTAITANVTGFVASRVGAATILLGQYLAPHIKKGSCKILTNTVGMREEDASNKVAAVFNVTAGAVEGIGTIYRGLELSARIFGASLSNNTVQVVTHKYGPSAGRFTEDTFQTVSNSVQIGTNIRFFKPSKLVKSTAKGAVISQSVVDRNSGACRDEPAASSSKVSMMAEAI